MGYNWAKNKNEKVFLKSIAYLFGNNSAMWTIFR